MSLSEAPPKKRIRIPRKTYPCTECGEVLDTYKLWYAHISYRHPPESEVAEEGEAQQEQNTSPNNTPDATRKFTYLIYYSI